MNKIHVEPLNTFDEVLSIISKMKKDETIGRYRSPYIYRGLPNIEYDLKTSLERNCREDAKHLEKCILRNFTKYASIVDKSNLINSEWRQLIIGQHHGLPTRMLDWTSSFLVALHFAMSEDSLTELDKHECVIWAIDSEETNKLLPEKYRNILNDKEARAFTVEMLEEYRINLEEYDTAMRDQSFIILEPPSIDERIVNQYSFFSVMPAEMTDFEKFLDERTKNTIKYVINKDIRWQIRDTLDLMNINERIMYPGYDGICKWLKRYYFSQKKKKEKE